MLNRIAKFLLVATSLSPVLGAVAVNQFSIGRNLICWLPWLIVAILLVAICWLLFRLVEKIGQKHQLKIAQFENDDKEALVFLLTYLLPFISSKDMAFEGQFLTGAYILVIIFLVVSHAGVFHFNPVMSLLGYHFYSIKNKSGISELLISKSEIRQTGKELETVRLTYKVYLHIG